MTMHRTLILTALMTLGVSGVPAQATVTQTTTPTTTVTYSPLPAAPAGSVVLPQTPELSRTVTLSVPLPGLTLEQALTSVAKAAGLSVLTQGLPDVTLRTSLAPMPARDAITTLINLYAPDVTATVQGQLLLIGTARAIERVQGSLAQPGADTTYRVVTLPGFTAAHLDRVTPFLPRTRAALFADEVIILSGTLTDLDAAEKFLRSLPAVGTAPVSSAAPTVTVSYPVTQDPAQLAAAIKEITGATVTTVSQTVVVKGTDAQQADVRSLITALNATRPPATMTASAADPVTRRTYLTPVPDVDAAYLRALYPTITVTPVADQSAVVVEARASQHTAVVATLKDTAARRAGRVTSYYTVTTGKAADLIAVLKREAPDADINVVDGRNMLAIRTTPAEQVRLSELIRLLQSSPVITTQAPTETITRSVALRYADAPSLAADLARLKPAPTPGGTDPQAPVGQDSATRAGEVTIIADPRTNSLLLTGPRTLVQDMLSAIDLIDVPVQSVRVRLRVEQVSVTDAQNLGVNWKVGVGGVSVGQQNGTLSVGYAPSLTPASINVALDAAKSNGRARTIIDSHFAALSGQDTSFQNGGELLFPATTSGSGQNATVIPGQTYSYGLQIKVRPRIAPDGTIVMTIDTNLGSTPSGGPMGSVQQTKQSLVSSLIIKPGETVVLGGIVTDIADQSQRGVPGLSSIPVIGALFGTQQRSTTQSALVFIVSAEPVNPQRTPTATTIPAAPQAAAATPAPVPPAPAAPTAPAPAPQAAPAPAPNDRGTETVDIPATGGPR